MQGVAAPGAITPLGHSVKDTMEGQLAGRSGVGPIGHFNASPAKKPATSKILVTAVVTVSSRVVSTTEIQGGIASQ